jgi:hypothetical protein
MIKLNHWPFSAGLSQVLGAGLKQASGNKDSGKGLTNQDDWQIEIPNENIHQSRLFVIRQIFSCCLPLSF